MGAGRFVGDAAEVHQLVVSVRPESFAMPTLPGCSSITGPGSLRTAR